MFLVEFAAPEDMAKILYGTSMAKLVSTFREDKHDGVLAMLRQVGTLRPERIEPESGHILVTYGLPNDEHVTFVIEGGRVFLRN